MLKVLLVLVVVFGLWSLIRARAPVTAFRRAIVVNVPREVAWEHFSRPRRWVSWRGASGTPTDVTPTDVVGPETVVTFGGRFQFRMTAFAPPDYWMWSATALGLTIDYDHRFERVSDRQTRMVFHQTVTGFGNLLFAALIGAGTAVTGHQAALQRLADEMNQLPAASH